MARLTVIRVPRRPVLLAGCTVLGGVAAVPALSGLLAGCAEQPPDPLIALLTQARSDAALATAAAQALRSRPDADQSGAAGKVETVTALAAARRAHADALAAELGDGVDVTAPPPGAEPPPPATGLGAVTAALEDAQRRAADAVPGLPRHRAALVGSIAACCGAYRTVLS